MADFEQDDEWQPPTEAEMKIIEARRERQNKISKLMGDYLLKGWRMLGICCPACDTILLQDKQGSNYCVACRELDSDNVKDDPALSDAAAQRQAAEHTQRASAAGSKNISPTEESLPTAATASSNGATAPSSTTASDMPHLPSDSVQPSDSHHVTHIPFRNPSHGLHIQAIDRHDSRLTSPDLTRHVPHPPSDTTTTTRPHTSDIQIHESFSSTRPRMFELPRHQPARHVPYNTSCGIPNHGPNPTSVMNQALDTLYAKLQTVTAEIEQSTEVARITDLCNVVKTLAETIEALHKAKSIMH